MKYLPVTARGRVPVDESGNAVFLSAPVGGLVFRVTKSPEVWACLADEGTASALGTLVEPRHFAPHSRWGDATVTRAIALMRYRLGTSFHAGSGLPLDFPGAGVMGVDDAGRQVFPRLDPAVIVMVKHPTQEAILLGRNAARPRYHSLVAGYVDLGESLEEACEREVREETGFAVHDVRYWGSAPWAQSGSIMLGFTARARDVRPVGDTDGELIDVRWVTRADLPGMAIPGEGSIAHAMMMEWLDGKDDGEVTE